MKEEIIFKDYPLILKNKKVLFAHWRAENVGDWPYHNLYLPLKNIFDKVIVFDPAKNYFNHSKEKMNSMFLELIKKEKPDYIVFGLIYDEFEIETLKIIKQISPGTITINLFSDDDWRFEDFTRYYARFFDYSMTTQDCIKEYEKEGLKNTFLFIAFNCDYLKPIKSEKKYDVSFFGRSNDKRAEYIRYLIKKGIKINVFGDGWAKYPELIEYYKGHLNSEELVKTINQTKINLGFSMGGYGKPQLKGRPFEVSACKSFILVEYFSKYLDFLDGGKEIIMFKDKEDLVKKINYYLKNEKEGEKIAENAYKRVIKDYNQKTKLLNFFIKTLKNKRIYRVSLKFDNKVIKISKEEIINHPNNIQLKDYDYITIYDKNCKFYQNKEEMQVYSLEKSGKGISCCDYYVNSKSIDNYLLFKAGLAFNKLKGSNFHKLIIPSQLMFTKKYFINNIDKIKDFISGKNNNLIDKSNTVFISIPLLETKEYKIIDYESMKSAFQMKFLDKLYSLYYEKKWLYNPYPYSLLIKSLMGELFIIKVIYQTLKDKDKLNKAMKGYQ